MVAEECREARALTKSAPLPTQRFERDFNVACRSPAVFASARTYSYLVIPSGGFLHLRTSPGTSFGERTSDAGQAYARMRSWHASPPTTAC
ncbi:MAG TPA: DUF1582 domain-containing protein [Rhodopirellula baltica]|uniref:Uncharacterized protein n=1 Tax=Rhodopirellula baltica (strain DSM 10527 / NCIMB 13988 / SH1) TaxID=243090 RepID=Q7UXP3_RHOBA|nr:hypothetical protein RB1204 [Rhodopirellula baltica SH 1]HBE66434.1 DUF1582 domain-containing protein [Rhodopirellula baltica]